MKMLTCVEPGARTRLEKMVADACGAGEMDVADDAMRNGSQDRRLIDFDEQMA